MVSLSGLFSDGRFKECHRALDRMSFMIEGSIAATVRTVVLVTEFILLYSLGTSSSQKADIKVLDRD